MQGTHLVESKIDLICLSLRSAMIEACLNLRCHKFIEEQVKGDTSELIQKRFLKDHVSSETSEIEIEFESNEISLI